MREAGVAAATELPAGASGDPRAALAAWRAQHAPGFDPVGFRFIEALAGRAEAAQGELRRILEAKLADALSAYGERFARARDEARQMLARTVERFPAACDELEGAFSRGEFAGLRRIAVRLESGQRAPALAELLAHARSSAEAAGAPGAGPAGKAVAQGELKSLAYFRETWSTLHVERQLARALAEAPDNAGPLNSQRLMLQALQLMRETSPEYLARFMAHAEALLWLEQADLGSRPARADSRLRGNQR